jgi:uncharacterized phage protein (TIGR01671 family)
MREIKFRAWSKRMGIMLSNESMLTAGREVTIFVQRMRPDLPDIKNAKGGLLLPTDDTDLEFMQYTGLKDRNGKEIYEGDIVTEHHAGLAYESDYYETRVVKWDGFGWMPFSRVVGGGRHDYAINLKEFNVIGNIYEDPELLIGGTGA